MKRRRLISKKKLVESLLQHGYEPFLDCWIGQNGDIVLNNIFALCGSEIRPDIEARDLAFMVGPQVIETFMEEWIEDYE